MMGHCKREDMMLLGLLCTIRFPRLVNYTIVVLIHAFKCMQPRIKPADKSRVARGLSVILLSAEIRKMYVLYVLFICHCIAVDMILFINIFILTNSLSCIYSKHRNIIINVLFCSLKKNINSWKTQYVRKLSFA